MASPNIGRHQESTPIKNCSSVHAARVALQGRLEAYPVGPRSVLPTDAPRTAVPYVDWSGERQYSFDVFGKKIQFRRAVTSAHRLRAQRLSDQVVADSVAGDVGAAFHRHFVEDTTPIGAHRFDAEEKFRSNL